MNCIAPRSSHERRNAAPDGDIGYFRKRAIQEQAAARKAACSTACYIHEQLAAMYRFRVSILTDAASEMGMTIALQRLALHLNAERLPGLEKAPNAIATAAPTSGTVRARAGIFSLAS